MSWNPNQGQDPNQQGQYGGYTPPPNPNDPYSGQQGGYQQQGGYPPPGAYPQQGGGYGPPAASAPYANWGQRAGAYLIDIVPAWILELIGAIPSS